MLAYKFRPSDKLDRIIDIVENKRLYCSDWSILNDPREGFFQYSLDYSHIVPLLTHSKKKYRVCALSKTYRKRLLWAHYANGFDGVAVGVDLPTHDRGRNFFDVIYQSRHPAADLHDSQPLDKKALFILKHKHIDWADEEELRIIQQLEYYKLVNPVQCIIVGHRVNEDRLEQLRQLCQQHAAILKYAHLDDGGVLAADCRDA
jgi:Protein of unknown function (DUF2971)